MNCDYWPYLPSTIIMKNVYLRRRVFKEIFNVYNTDVKIVANQ